VYGKNYYSLCDTFVAEFLELTQASAGAGNGGCVLNISSSVLVGLFELLDTAVQSVGIDGNTRASLQTLRATLSSSPSPLLFGGQLDPDALLLVDQYDFNDPSNASEQNDSGEK
jgi:hypothetical protein